MASKISNKNQPQPQKSTLHLLQVNDYIKAQDRDANVMLFAWMPLMALFDAEDAYQLYKYLDLWNVQNIIRKLYDYASIDVVASEFHASMTL